MAVGPIDKYTIEQQIDDVISEYCAIYNIDLYNYNFRSGIQHNELNHIFIYIYKHLFRPEIGQLYNKNSLIDYNDIELLNIIASKFIDICALFNKSMGLVSFSLFTGINTDTLRLWTTPEGKAASPGHYAICKAIQENNKNMLISKLKDSTLGAVAVANNDVETGLRWADNKAPQLQGGTVYILPSERMQRLKLEQQDSETTGS